MAGISLTSVTKSFGGNTVLHGVSLDIAAGEFVALVGPSGCGKTTLMRIVAGIEQASSGTLRIQGRDATSLRAGERDVAMVFQSYALYPHLTVAENIAVPLAMRRLNAWQRLPLLGGLMPGARATRRRIAGEVAAAAESLGLGALLDRRPAQLSGGQRQRVALARAMVRRPAAFLMDEPLSNLDASLRVQTRREIVAIHRRAGAATLYVTHDQSEALTMADRVAVMQGGRILQVAPPREIYADPADLRVATFIGSPRINLLPGEAGRDGLVRVGDRLIGLRCAARGPLTLGIRPEAFVLAAEGLPARAEAVEFLGESVLLHTRHEASGSPLVLRLPPEAAGRLPASGAALHLGFAPGAALLFDQDGARRRAEAVVAREPALV
ncbi:ABC transporter ATP-binding protein [Teichococcus oryzae]|uniref:ABC transporter ATP-binding protein n=1 Tax=Teichococcus oryzae TaxID=1608942 RepID=A0A5B2TFL0_9PROT|nr:ABC transporter ATP-binding protein [Pseudoroseomonas oryzae]KAA2212914.1 ABC transporter ATP-binding protein [Pseudoroseomonas oryzae]